MNINFLFFKIPILIVSPFNVDITKTNFQNTYLILKHSIHISPFFNKQINNMHTVLIFHIELLDFVPLLPQGHDPDEHGIEPFQILSDIGISSIVQKQRQGVQVIVSGGQHQGCETFQIGKVHFGVVDEE